VIGWLFAFAVAVALFGLLLVALASKARASSGLAGGTTVALDNVTICSEQLKLVGRPDRIVRDGKMLIPEEWKSSKRVSEGHRLQLGAYFLLIEAEYGARPPHGFIVLGDKSRVKVENTERLRSAVLAIAERIREHRRALHHEVPVHQPVAKCRMCGQRGNCRQATLEEVAKEP
jgi:CRISPR-associated exonuclease Cas4